MAGCFSDAEALRSGADMSEENGGINFLGDGGEVGVIPCGTCLTIDARDCVKGVVAIPAETKAVAVEIGGLGRVGGESLARVEGLSDDGTRGTGYKVCGTDWGAEEGAETTHCGLRVVSVVLVEVWLDLSCVVSGLKGLRGRVGGAEEGSLYGG